RKVDAEPLFEQRPVDARGRQEVDVVVRGERLGEPARVALAAAQRRPVAIEDRNLHSGLRSRRQIRGWSITAWTAREERDAQGCMLARSLTENEPIAKERMLAGEVGKLSDGRRRSRPASRRMNRK